MSFFLLCGGSHVQSSFLPEFAFFFFDFARVHMLGLGAWSDDLVVLLVEFLEDDTKLAQFCTDWQNVQHRYTARPGPCNARDALGAGGSRRELSRAHASHTAPLFFSFQEVFSSFLSHMSCALSRYLVVFGGHFGSEVSCGSSMASASWMSLLGGEPCSTLTQDILTGFCLSLCCQIGPVFSVPLRHQTSSHRRHGLGILHRGMTAGYVMFTNAFYRAF